MPRVIVANVDSDFMCGNDMSPEIHALSSMCCDRLLVMVGDDDLIVLPHSVSDGFIDYVSSLLGRKLSARNVVVPAGGDERQLILNEDTLNAGDVAAAIRERAGSLEGWRLEAYFLDRAVLALGDDLGLAVHGTDQGTERAARDFLRGGGAESFNSKVLFRQLAAAVGAPVPAGGVATAPTELARCLTTLLPHTGRVMIKQDRNSGGAGNTVVTRHGETTLTGASRVQQVGTDDDLSRVAEELWPSLALQRNTQVVAEVYHASEEVYYSELWVPGPVGSPTMLNFGEMRMEPTFIGFEIPSRRTHPVDVSVMTMHSMALAREAGRRGFVGYMNIDSILTSEGSVVFNEVNGRMGCCTNIDYLARQLAGDAYTRERAILTYNWFPCGSFVAATKALEEAGVAFDHGTRTGVLVAVEDVERARCLDYMVVGRDHADADALERRAVAALGSAS